MNQFEQQMTEFWETDFPDTWTFLWSPKEAQNISSEHKDQIHFINKEGTKFLNDWIGSSKMLFGCDPYRYGGKDWHPFNDEYFTTVERFTITENCNKKIKKWLYNKEIPFSKYVFIDSDRSGKSVMLTWKMVIKYWEGLFFAHDLIIVDSSLEWGLFCFHESELYFGKDVKFDREKVMELNRIVQEWQNKLK